jgi:hypothetical protein
MQADAWLTAAEVEALAGSDNPTNGALHPLRVTRNKRIVHPSAAQRLPDWRTR